MQLFLLTRAINSAGIDIRWLSQVNCVA